ncbi:MAG: hypothetical protein ABI183_03800 [Polyangiaceae bacterium]
MMQSILSLIHETLTTSSSSASSNAHEAPKSGTRGEFESILTSEDHASMRCASATRIKARSNSIEEHGDHVSADDESDDEEATTCVNVDDFAAWALTNTINAPPPAMAAKNPSISMVAVKMPKASSPAPQPLPALNKAGETIPAAALAPKTQEFMAPMTQEIAAVKDDEPSSRAITREFPTPTAANKTQEIPATQQMSAFIEKMARSRNATDIPPPSAIPMVSGAPPANSSAPRVSAPQNHAPVIDIHARMSNIGNSNSSNNSNNNNASSNNGNNNNAKTSTTSDDDALPLSTTVGSFANDAPPDAALRPTILLNAFDPRNMPSMPTRALATMDIQASIEARQQAVDRAVNQLTLSRSADGEMDIPELGRIRVEATSHDGEVDVRITAAREETQQLVSGHTHEIVIDARSAAIPIVDLRVKLDPRAEPMDLSSSNRGSQDERRGNSKDDNSSKKQAPIARIHSRARFVL